MFGSSISVASEPPASRLIGAGVVVYGTGVAPATAAWLLMGGGVVEGGPVRGACTAFIVPVPIWVFLSSATASPF